MAEIPAPTVHLPPGRLRPVLPLLAFGLEGPWLSRRAASDLGAAVRGRPELAGLGRALAAWRFERQPLDPDAVRGLLAAGRAGVDPGQRALARVLFPRLGPPEAARDWPARRDGGRQAALVALDQGLADPEHALYWRGRALEYALAEGLPDLAERVLADLAVEPGLTALAARLRAEVAAAFAGPQAVLAALEPVDAALFPRFVALARADALAATGDRAGAGAVLARAWRGDSWQPGLTLRLHELLFPVPGRAVARIPGRVTVCLYTWNRCGPLARALESLSRSRLGPARLLVCDNGSGDATQAVCREASGRFAAGQFSLIRLPVNIGAPAARNWLVRACAPGPDDLVAFVDDDVTLPPDWLERLAGVLAADPGAEVAGARILAGDAAVPVSADVRLLPPGDGRAVRPLVNCPRGPDLGLLAATRPCASVSGCCHLFRGSALASPAPFDIRFSPSQFDDLARDVAAFVAGGRCVLAGEVAVAHHQPRSSGPPASPDRVLGARIKLDGLFSTPDMLVAAGRDLDTAWEELETKWARLSRAGIGGD